MGDVPSRKLAVLLHADVVGSTALVQLNETVAHQRIQDTFQRFSATIGSYNGVAHEIRGDALVAEFSRASDALSAALAFQAVNTAHNEALPDDVRAVLRVGIAMGEVVVADNTVTGEGVVMAQRLEQLAAPGRVCIQGAAYETVPKRLPFDYENLGERILKGFEQPIRAYQAVLQTGHLIPEPEVSSPVLEGTRTLPDEPSIAVLPFANMSGNPEQEYFSDGVAEDIITELSRFPDLFVIARNSSFSYKGKSTKVQDIAADLGVQYVVEGSVRSAGTRIRVTAQLIDAGTGGHIWAERYDRELTDIFLVQDDITQTVVTTVAGKVKSTAQDIATRKSSEDVAAYDYVLRGQGIVSDTKDKNRKARTAYETALDIDPLCARGYAGLAMCDLVGLANHWEASDEQAMHHGLECSAKAVELDHSDSKSQYLLAYFLNMAGRLDEAQTHVERAVALNPNDADALASLGVHLHGAGAAEDAIACYAKAIRLNPYHPVWYLWHLGVAYYSAGRYDEALVPLREAISRHPGFMVPRRALAAALAQLGRDDEATTVVKEILTDEPDACVRKGDAYLLGAGQASTPRPWVEHWVEGLRKAGLPE